MLRKARRLRLLLFAGFLALVPLQAGASALMNLDWVWSAVEQKTSERGFTTADLDGDGRSELIVAFDVSPSVDAQGGYWSVIEYDGGAFHSTWTSTDFEDGLSGLEYLAELNQLVAVSPTLVRFYSASSLEVIREFGRTASRIEDFSISDLDGDGQLELVTCGDAGLEVSDFDTGQVEAANPELPCFELATGQFDADPARELVIAGSTGGVVADGATLAVEWVDPAGFGSDIATSDVDGDGLDEIVAGSSEETGVRAFEFGGASFWSLPDVNAVELILADVTGDASMELLARTDGTVRAVDAATGMALWTWWTNVGTPYGTALAAGEADGDEGIEVFIGPRTGSEYGILAVDAATQAIEGESVYLGWSLESFGIGEISGDGRMQVIVGPAGEFQISGRASRLLLDLESRRQAGVWAMADPLNSAAAGTIAAQVDDDSAFEVCFAELRWPEEWRIFCQDGRTGEIEWATDSTPVEKLHFHQLDQDPQIELIASTAGPFLHSFEAESG